MHGVKVLDMHRAVMGGRCLEVGGTHDEDYRALYLSAGYCPFHWTFFALQDLQEDHRSGKRQHEDFRALVRMISFAFGGS